MKSKRLLKIADKVKQNSIVADIGTDHGYVPVYLMQNKICKKVIASDISKGSLKKIEDYVLIKSLDEKIDIRLGNGLEVLKPYEVDTVIIAGMGGVLITEILDKDWSLTNSINNFILQPMIGAKELREYLINNSFNILENDLVKEDGKYYEIIIAEKGKMKMPEEIFLELPKDMLKSNNPLVGEYVEYKIKYAESILNDIFNKKGKNVEKRKSDIEELIKLYKEVKNEYKL